MSKKNPTKAIAKRPQNPDTFVPTGKMVSFLREYMNDPLANLTDLFARANISMSTYYYWRKRPEWVHWWHENVIRQVSPQASGLIAGVAKRLKELVDSGDADHRIFKLCLDDLQRAVGHLPGMTTETGSGTHQITIVLPQGSELPSPSSLLEEEVIEGEFEVKDED